MSTVMSLLRKLALLLRRGQFGQELDEEMTFHREQMERELREQGKTGKRRAMPRCGNLATLRACGNAAMKRSDSAWRRWRRMCASLCGR